MFFQKGRYHALWDIFMKTRTEREKKQILFLRTFKYDSQIRYDAIWLMNDRYMSMV